MDQLSDLPANRNTPLESSHPTDAIEFAARYIAVKFGIDYSLAANIAMLAGIAVESRR